MIDRAFAINDAAEILGVSYATVRRLLLEGRIAHQRVSPRRTVIRESALRRYLEEVTTEPGEVRNLGAQRDGNRDSWEVARQASCPCRK
jgi:excisionase family DNA binding protein